MATYLHDLLIIYKAGNRKPRGTVIERLQWQEFQAFRRREERIRLAKRKYAPDLPADCVGCAIGKRWLWREDTALREQFESGWSLEAMARAHERTYGAIIARLVKLKYIGTRFLPGRGEVALLFRKTFRYRPEIELSGGNEIFAVMRDKKWRGVLSE
jgi:hypothetical protein